MIRTPADAGLEREVSRGQENEKSGARRLPEDLPVVRRADAQHPKELPRIVEEAEYDPQEPDRAKGFRGAQGNRPPQGRSEADAADRGEAASEGTDCEKENVEVECPGA